MQHTGNYFIAFTLYLQLVYIAFTLLGTNNLSRDDLKYMGGPMGYM